MFTYDNDYTEQEWRHEADARELAELDAELRDMQEYPAPISVMENAESKRYLAIGGPFGDDTGAIGMEISARPKMKKEAA